MVLGVIMMATMVPTMIGLNEATQGSRDQEEARRSEARKQRGHLVATVSLTQGTPTMRQQVHNAKVQVGLDGRLYITKHPSASMVPFNGGFHTHPDFAPDNTSGLVTVSGEKAPTLRWVFRDAKTHEMRWGGRLDSEGHVCGPFDWTPDEQYLTMEGWEGWLAVRLPDDEMQDSTNDVGGVQGHETWRLYFDANDDGANLPPGAQGLEVRLKRTVAES
ncbi:hypothetical protein N7468_005401 [Penicillium chermesinum]|uniref:Uncharacterized protein n=1 Tax=Penicillium chermesinum TaxID=63820 RepID=A0A9W9NZC2_9EURO|nr:uncharacterized protein N7468_005401 [Penicillium chermesinum]KAJ5232445.1 hypothetical protein N7468_005401 [Penicillium chermesinum]KAJ6172103.1 hypothetical protein N7470_001170 [Penicillium chermesinum]